MEYNLQKTLSNESDYEFHYPIDFNTESFEDLAPGIGQIVPYDNFIVPLHNNSDLTTIFKEPTIEQLGGGQEIDKNDETYENTNEVQEETNEKSNENIKNFEPTKRKNMDSAIFESFMHPKMFKTKLVSLEKNVTTKNTVKKPSEETKPPEKTKSQKHKFKIY